MDFISELKDMGVNTDEALKRLMNNSNLYKRMLGKFTNTVKDLEVLPYLKEGDFEKALENAHTMKGITGNLSLTPLFNAYSEVVSLLRAGDNEKARSIVEGILPTQEDMVSRLEKVIK